MPPLVEIHELTKRYGTFAAVDALTLTIPRGCIFALLGPNGAGKTTTIKLLMGMLQPTQGSLRVCGHDAFLDGVAAKQRIGYLPDQPAFYDFLRGREIIRFAGEMHGLPRRLIAERGQALAERLQISDALEEFAENYSCGMKKKLGLVCALLHEPHLLVLDEPTNGLDPHGTQELHALMREAAASGQTVLFSTHLLDQTEQLADLLAVMQKKQIVAEGTLTELRARFDTDASLESLFFRLTAAESAVAVASGE